MVGEHLVRALDDALDGDPLGSRDCLRRTAPASGGGASDSLVLLRGTRSQSRPLLLGPNLDDAASAIFGQR